VKEFVLLFVRVVFVKKKRIDFFIIFLVKTKKKHLTRRLEEEQGKTKTK